MQENNFKTLVECTYKFWKVNILEETCSLGLYEQLGIHFHWKHELLMYLFWIRTFA